jgi:hypothetical protein
MKNAAKAAFSTLATRRSRLRPWIVGCLFWLTVGEGRAVDPVEFKFHIPKDDRNPYARDLWADILTPSGARLRLPVFFFGNGEFAVRARASEAGEYRLAAVSERVEGRAVQLSIAVTSEVKQTVKTPATLPQVAGYRGKPARFLFGNGEHYSPIGANVPWATGNQATRTRFYQHAISEFSREGLNWMRIWMAHWGGLNLEWLPADLSGPPQRGALDARVALEWDKIVAAAETKNVYLQIVLQHHGQYSTTVNPNWKEHPWNAANRGGFLTTPGEFFTADLALGLTGLKYRYIVARWGYSPAVLAWELFNEVHWTDPIHQGKNERTVADWHDAMADYLRGTDPYRHLVTTSTENLRSPIYAKMDFYQPHLYAHNMLAGARQFAVAPENFERPIFYGEVGDDHMDLTAEQKASGIAIVPPVWASLMGQGFYAAQPWLGDRLLQRGGRLEELGAVARFLKATALSQRDLTAFSAVVACETRVPFTLAAGQVWQRRMAPEFAVPLDGREPLEFADIPRSYVGSAENLQSGFPARATYHLDFPREMTLRARVTGVSPKGAALRFSVDGQPALEKTWTMPEAGTITKEKPLVLPVVVAAGRHTLVVENPGSPDWFELGGIDFPHEVPVLAAIGRREKDFLALWLWHREGVFALKTPAAVSGELMLEAVPAGIWKITWWDTLKGIPSTPVTVEHGGGALKLPTPSINRHAAVVLERQP